MQRHEHIGRAGRRGGGLALVLAAAVCFWPLPARAYTPESPEVRRMIEPALKWLESQSDHRLGGKCLIGLSFLKNGADADHPKVVEAQKACESAIETPAPIDNYSIGLALVFLIESDPEKNRELAARYVDAILKKQQAGGAWGYQHSTNVGDTSQTQYPIMGLWLAARNGVDVPVSAIEKACGWLVRTQDPSGGWGYQGQDSGSYQQRINQATVQPSLCAAGLGALYICADLLEVQHAKKRDEERTQPAALRKVETEEERTRRGSLLKAFDPQLVRKATADGNGWFDRNFTIRQNNWNHYYLYALERYQSYRELVERRPDPNPAWYNAGVELLQRTQNRENGSWAGEDNIVVATCFSVLFLARSSQQSTKKSATLGDAVLLGGMGLPPNTADLRERDGKIVETPFAGSVDELLAVLNDPDNPELAALAGSGQALTLDSSVTKRSGQIARLRALVSAGNYESRLVAVRTLGRVRDLDNVPVLVYALTDPDMRIVIEADKGLRFVSRKFEGVGLPIEPREDDRQAAIKAWKAWYKSIRPDGEFLD